MAQAITPSMSEGRRQALERRRAQALKGRAAPSARPAGAQSMARPSAAVAGQTQAAKSVPPQQSQRSTSATTFSTGRAASVARRQAMTSRGKVGIAMGSDAERTRAETARARPVERKADKDGCGCGGRKEERQEARSASVSAGNGGMSLSTARPAPKVKAGVRRNIGQPEGRQLSQARRRMLAEKGRTALSQTERARSPVARARHLNPDLNGRELAREVRSERSRGGDRGRNKSSVPSGRQRPTAGSVVGGPSKVSSSQTAQGQTVTGPQMGRSKRLTGDELSCRVITGTEYLAADIFREFCQTDMVPNPSKVSFTKTAAGRQVTGTEVGRSTKVTGNEAGNCKRVTGNEYLPADQVSEFCGISPQPAPAKITATRTGSGRQVSGSNIDRPSRMTGMEAGAGRATTGNSYTSPQRASGEKVSLFKKVGVTSTLRGGQVTGTLLGRNERVTGNEPGSCRQITGDEYIGGEQYQAFCGTAPRPEAPKFGVSETTKGKVVTGTQAGRGERVTGDEPGTCKTVTGTPYAGTEIYREYCAPGAGEIAAARGRAGRNTPGMPLTGLQPGIGGKMTGEQRKGAYEAITGTPYGQDQFAQSGGGLGAVPGNPDFPQSLDGTPWAATFSVSTPAREAQRARRLSGVTGTRYEQGHITGPFVMGEGKITGTEEFRFGGPESAAPVASSAAPVSVGERPTALRSNITGEGMDTGLRITGDDWGRNERVTGTEGRSAMQRNPTRRGAAVGAMGMMARREPQEKKPAEVAPSRVTGSSGNTEKGALITVSGGARG